VAQPRDELHVLANSVERSTADDDPVLPPIGVCAPASGSAALAASALVHHLPL